MTPPKPIERRLFLASSAATVVANVTGCGDDESGGLASGSSDAGATDADGGRADASSPSDAGQTNQSTSTSIDAAPTNGATSTSGETYNSSLDASTGELTSSGDGSAPYGETPSSGGTASSSDTSGGGIPANDACFEGGGTQGGVSDDAGAGVLCSTNTDNGDHCHALVIPQDDVASGVIEATYVLEDGGTGHTHTVMLSAYDFFFLQAGTAYSVQSTTDAGHNHTCWITCPV